MNGKVYTREPDMLVDLRTRLPETRDQGPRPTCLAFATSDAHSNFQGITQHLSVEYLTYYAYIADGHQDYSLGLSTDAVIKVLKNEGQPYETEWPYDPHQAHPVQPLPNLSPLYNADCLENQTISIFDLTQILDKQKSIVIGVEITETFFGPFPIPILLMSKVL